MRFDHENSPSTREQLINFYKTKIQNIDEEIAQLTRQRAETQKELGDFMAQKLNREYKDKSYRQPGYVMAYEDMLFVVGDDLNFKPFYVEGEMQ